MNNMNQKMIDAVIGITTRNFWRVVNLILTTQTADWFEKQGFIPDEINTLPERRREKWNPKRGSKLFRLKLKK